MTWDEAVKFLKSIHYSPLELTGKKKWFIRVGPENFYGPWDEETFIAKVEDLKQRVEAIGIEEYNLGQSIYVQPWPLRPSKPGASARQPAPETEGE